MVEFMDRSLEAKKRYYGKYKKKKCSFLAAKFTEFCRRTDLHGYKYIVLEELNVVERSSWVIAIIMSTALACYLVYTAYNWYARNPIVTVIESTQGAIWDIPFPAVTICNLNTISRKAARAFAGNVTLPPNMTRDYVFAVLKIMPLMHASFEIPHEQQLQIRSLQAIMDLNNLTMEVILKNLSSVSSCNDLIQRCMWKNTIYRCDTLFQQIFTFFNLCCSFNYFAVKPSNRKSPLDSFQVEIPRRVASCGYQTALSVLVDPALDDYYSASIASQGVLVFIDESYNYADVDSPVRLINPSTEVLIALSPERTYSTPGVRGFKPKERQCYFADEMKLGALRQYSFHNCVAYQRFETVRNVCGCVPYFFPKNTLTDYQRTCTFNDIECLQSLVGGSGPQNIIRNEIMQNCLPECEHYDYPLEIGVGKLMRNVRLEGQTFFRDMNLENKSLLNVFFNDLVSTRYRRDVYLNWQNLLASFGGLLSLMLGFTLISGFDLIFFFSFGVLNSFLTFSNKELKKERDGNTYNTYKGHIMPNVINVQPLRRSSAIKPFKNKKPGSKNSKGEYYDRSEKY